MKAPKGEVRRQTSFINVVCTMSRLFPTWEVLLDQFVGSGVTVSHSTLWHSSVWKSARSSPQQLGRDFVWLLLLKCSTLFGLSFSHSAQEGFNGGRCGVKWVWVTIVGGCLPALSSPPSSCSPTGPRSWSEQMGHQFEPKEAGNQSKSHENQNRKFDRVLSQTF